MDLRPGGHAIRTLSQSHTYALVPEASSWLHKNALQSFLEETCKERLAEVQRIVEHVELSLTELLQRAKEINDKEADDEVQKPFPK